jgi:hypothetical protein
MHGSGHAQAQFVPGIFHEDANLVYKARPQFLGLHILWRKLGNGRDKSDPSIKRPIRKAVRSHGRGHPRMHVAQIGSST